MMRFPESCNVTETTSPPTRTAAVNLLHQEDFTSQRLALSDEAFTLAKTITTSGKDFYEPRLSYFISDYHMFLTK